jgi:hypothetical protein
LQSGKSLGLDLTIMEFALNAQQRHCQHHVVVDPHDAVIPFF